MTYALLALLSSGSTALVILLVFLKSPAIVEGWINLAVRSIAFLLRSFHMLRERFDRSVVKWDLQARLNLGAQEINDEAPGILPFGLRIEWVGAKDAHHSLEKGKVIVRLKKSINQEENLARAALGYTTRGLLPHARHILDSSLRDATILSTANRILGQYKESGARDYFRERILEPRIEQDDQLGSDLLTIEALRTKGFFTRIFLNEVEEVGRSSFPGTLRSGIQQETRAFAGHLEEIATKELREDVPLEFNGVRIKIGIILVARSTRLERLGISPYIDRVRINVLRGYETVYIVGWGDQFRAPVLSLVEQVARRGLVQIRRTQEFPIWREAEAVSISILAVCQPNATIRAEQRHVTEEVRRALTKWVPEILGGEIEIVNIARLQGIGAKVGVRFVGDVEDARGAVEMCSGEGGERVKLIKAELPEAEWLGIFPWLPGDEERILEALKLRDDDLVRLSLDRQERVAHIEVRDKRAAARAIGSDGANVRLAEEVVGWGIEITRASSDQRVERRSEDSGLSGVVGFFDAARGFGFINGSDGRDYFVHASGIIGKGWKVLRRGERVAFEAKESRKGLEARKVRRLAPRRT